MTSRSWQELDYIYYDTYNLVIFFHIVYATLGYTHKHGPYPNLSAPMRHVNSQGKNFEFLSTMA